MGLEAAVIVVLGGNAVMVVGGDVVEVGDVMVVGHVVMGRHVVGGGYVVVVGAVVVMENVGSCSSYERYRSGGRCNGVGDVEVEGELVVVVGDVAVMAVRGDSDLGGDVRGGSTSDK